jgi:hypothetical protein
VKASIAARVNASGLAGQWGGAVGLVDDEVQVPIAVRAGEAFDQRSVDTSMIAGSSCRGYAFWTSMRTLGTSDLLSPGERASDGALPLSAVERR